MLSPDPAIQGSTQNQTTLTRVEIIDQIDELFRVTPFGRSVAADKKQPLENLDPKSWNNQEIDYFAESFARLFSETQNPNLFKLYGTTIGQAGLLATILTDYVFRIDCPYLKISLSNNLRKTGIPSAHQISWALWHSKNNPFEDSAATKETSYFEWAGQTVADDIVSACPENAVALVNEFSNATIALYIIEHHWGFEECLGTPSVLRQFLSGYFHRLDEKLDLTDATNQNVMIASYILLLPYQEQSEPIYNIASFFGTPLHVSKALLNFTYCAFAQGDTEDAIDGMQLLRTILFQDMLSNDLDPSNSFLLATNIDSIQQRFPRTEKTAECNDFIDMILSLKRSIFFINQAGLRSQNSENDDGA
jgi:hypothetical protein